MSHDTAMETAGDDLAIRKELHGWFGDPWSSSACYDGDGHLFVDPSTADYDETTAALAKDRVRALLNAIG